MKITNHQLRQIITEELNAVLIEMESSQPSAVEDTVERAIAELEKTEQGQSALDYMWGPWDDSAVGEQQRQHAYQVFKDTLTPLVTPLANKGGVSVDDIIDNYIDAITDYHETRQDDPAPWRPR